MSNLENFQALPDPAVILRDKGVRAGFAQLERIFRDEAQSNAYLSQVRAWNEIAQLSDEEIEATISEVAQNGLILADGEVNKKVDVYVLQRILRSPDLLDYLWASVAHSDSQHWSDTAIDSMLPQYGEARSDSQWNDDFPDEEAVVGHVIEKSPAVIRDETALETSTPTTRDSTIPRAPDASSELTGTTLVWKFSAAAALLKWIGTLGLYLNRPTIEIPVAVRQVPEVPVVDWQPRFKTVLGSDRPYDLSVRVSSRYEYGWLFLIEKSGTRRVRTLRLDQDDQTLNATVSYTPVGNTDQDYFFLVLATRSVELLAAPDSAVEWLEQPEELMQLMDHSQYDEAARNIQKILRQATEFVNQSISLVFDHIIWGLDGNPTTTGCAS